MNLANCIRKYGSSLTKDEAREIRLRVKGMNMPSRRGAEVAAVESLLDEHSARRNEIVDVISKTFKPKVVRPELPEGITQKIVKPVIPPVKEKVAEKPVVSDESIVVKPGSEITPEDILVSRSKMVHGEDPKPKLKKAIEKDAGGVFADLVKIYRDQDAGIAKYWFEQIVAANTNRGDRVIHALSPLLEDKNVLRGLLFEGHKYAKENGNVSDYLNAITEYAFDTEAASGAIDVLKSELKNNPDEFTQNLIKKEFSEDYPGIEPPQPKKPSERSANATEPENPAEPKKSDTVIELPAEPAKGEAKKPSKPSDLRKAELAKELKEVSDRLVNGKESIPTEAHKQEMLRKINDFFKDDGKPKKAKRPSLKNQKGENEIIADLASYGADLIRAGHDTYSKFRAEMKRQFGEVWDKIKKHIRAAFDAAKKVLSNQHGQVGAWKEPLNKYREFTKENPDASKTEIQKATGLSAYQIDNIESLKSAQGAPDVLQKPEEKKRAEKVEKEINNIAIGTIKQAGNVIKNRKRGWRLRKEDTKLIERLLSVPTHYFEKVRGLYGMLKAGLARQDNYYNLINWLQQTNEGESLLKRFDSFRKQDRPGYRKLKEYLIHRDQNQIGYNVEVESGFYKLYDLNGKLINKFERESDAWNEAIRLEASDYKASGASDQAVDSLIATRRITNNGFDLLVSALRGVEAKFKKLGLPLPVTSIYKDGKKTKVDLKVALAMMGSHRGYYMPRIRKSGRYMLTATKKGEHPILEFFDYETSAAFRQTSLEKKGYTVEKDLAKSMPEDVFQMAGEIIAMQSVINQALEKSKSEMNSAGLEELANRMEELFAKSIAEQVANVFKGRGFRQHMIKRSSEKGKDVWIGYETDPVLALGKYVRGIAAGEAKKIMALDMVRSFTGTDESWAEYKQRISSKGGKPDYKGYLNQVNERRVDPVKQPNAFKDGKAFMEDMLRNEEFADRFIGTIKGIAVLKYLAGRISALPVNLSAMVTSVPAAISEYTGTPIRKTFKLIAKSSSDYYKYKWGDKSKVDKWTQKLFKHIEDSGWHTAQYNKEALSVLKTKFGRGWENFIDFAMIGFGVTEQYNRISTISAAYQGIRQQHKGKWGQAEHEAALVKAKKTSDRAHAVYGKVNRPHIARGSNIAANIAQSFYVFRTFSHNYLLTMKEMGLGKNSIYMALFPAVIAGLGASVVTPVVSKLLASLGLGGDDPEEALYTLLEEEINPTAAKVARFGLAGLAGISLKGSLAIGVMDVPTNIKELLGAPGSMVADVYYGGKNIIRGDYMKGAEKLIPMNAIGSAIKGYREYSEGVTTNTNAPVFFGNERLKADIVDAALRMASFNPAGIAEKKEKLWSEKRVIAKYGRMKRDIYAKIKGFYLLPENKRTKPKWANIIVEIDNFNKRIESRNLYRIVSPITGKSIKSNIKRSFRPSKKERTRKQ